jgi:hypothetical protein
VRCIVWLQVAWKITLHTPEYPEGRQLVVIANDITVQVSQGGLPLVVNRP